MDSLKTFQELYRDFAIALFTYQKANFVYKERFIGAVVKTFSLLCSEKWESFKTVAIITGMQLLKVVISETEAVGAMLQSLPESEEFSSQRYVLEQRRDTLIPVWELVFTKIYSSNNRDDRLSLEPCTPLYKDLSSSPPILPTIRSIILKGLSHMPAFQLSNSHLENSDRAFIFQCMKADLLYAIRYKTDMADIALRILSSFLRFIDLKMSNTELDIIYYYLYDSDQLLALLAAEVVFTLHYEPDQPDSIIHKLINLNRESFVKNEDLVMDAMYDEISPHLSWERWHRVVMEAGRDELPDYMAMLAAYARKATLGYTPKLRWRLIRTIPQEELELNRLSYTEYFSGIWADMLSNLKIQELPRALVKLIKMVQFFDESISYKVLDEVGRLLVGLLVTSTDEAILMESSLSLATLGHLAQDTAPRQLCMALLIGSLLKTALSDFVNLTGQPSSSSMLIQCKLLALAYYHTFYDDSKIWKICIERLRQAQAAREDCAQSQLSICILYQLLVRRASLLLKDLDRSLDSNISYRIYQCVSRLVVLQLEVRPFLVGPYPAKLKKTAFYAMVDLVEYLGPKVSHKRLWLLSMLADDEWAQAIICYTVHVTLPALHCSDAILNGASIDDCCLILNKTCHLFSKGVLNVLLLTPLIKLLGKNQVHDDVILRTLSEMTSSAPQSSSWRNLSLTLFNVIMGLLEEALVQCCPQESREIVSVDCDGNSGTKWESSRYRQLYSVVATLTSGKAHLPPSLLSGVGLRIHLVLIDRALRTSASSPTSLSLLYTLRPLLQIEDIPFLITFLEQYDARSVEATRYVCFLKQLYHREYRYCCPGDQ